MAVWEVPTPVEGDAAISVKVGTKCEHNCSLSGAVVEVLDAAGRQVSRGVLGESPAPGTSALYWTKLEFRGPKETGYHEWTASFAERGGPTAHGASSFRFGLVTGAKATHRVAVQVSDAATKACLANAYVRIGSSTVYADDSGRAAASVPAGPTEVVVWKRDHQMSRSSIQVSSDEDLSVELTPQPCKYCPDST